MKKGDIHALWAPLGATWTPWVKPVLFAHLDEETTPGPVGPLPAWIQAEVISPLERHALDRGNDQHPYRRSHALDDVAAVIDLPGSEGTLAGLALAEHGFRPVPLYNAMMGPSPVLDLQPIMKVLVDGAAGLASLPPGAPPAFLLDADRMGRGRRRELGNFDNRSVCFPTDFPSATTLRSSGIRRAVLIHSGSARPAIDLAETLVQWQEQGIGFFLARVDTGDPAKPRTVHRPSWFQRLFHVLERRQLFRNASGVFGELLQLPQGYPSSGG
jgi:hypothetical protein